MKTEQLPPPWILVAVLTMIFCVEEALEYSLDHYFLETIPPLAKAAINAGALTLIMSFFICWLVMRPLRLALASGAAMAQAITDAAADAIVTTDENGVIESFNPAAVRMFGYSAKEAIGQDVAMLMNDTHPGEHQLRPRNAGLRREVLALRQDRTEFPVELTMSEARFGGARRFIGIVRDISEHKRMEHALRTRAAELRLIIDNTPAMIVYYDASLRCQFANKRYADFFGFDPSEIAGKHLRDIIAETAYPVAEAEYRKALAGHPLTYERTQLLRNGNSVPLEVNLVPHIGENGKSLGCYGLLVNIAQRKEDEERIRRMTNYDSVTGLADRQLFYHCLGQDISVARRDQKELALIYLGLGQFKNINQTFGHQAGDQVLVAVGERIRYQARRSDTVARMGGDEFAVVMSNGASRTNAADAGERISKALAKPFYLDGQTHTVQIKARVGIAFFPADAHDANTLVKAAYVAMEKSK